MYYHLQEIQDHYAIVGKQKQFCRQKKKDYLLTEHLR